MKDGDYCFYVCAVYDFWLDIKSFLCKYGCLCMRMCEDAHTLCVCKQAYIFAGEAHLLRLLKVTELEQPKGLVKIALRLIRREATGFF